jgi:diphthine synthase
MIYLLGVGWSKDDVTQRTLSIIRKSKVFVDRYTSIISEDFAKFIASEAGSELHYLSRSEMEEGARKLIAQGKSSDIAIVTGGDPLIATTHKILFIEAKKEKIPMEVIHAPSVFTAAIGESGLDFYRFGRTFTIPKWSEHYKPLSFYETLASNQANNSHSIALLDYEQEKMQTIPLKSAIEVLEKAEAHYKKGIIKGEKKVFVLHNLCLKEEKKSFITLKEAKEMEATGGVTTVIIPANLTDIEKEIITAMYG